MRLIDADDLLMDNTWAFYDENGNRNDACIAVENAPTVEAVPVRHGHWYKTYDDEGEAWMCSECCEEWAFEEGHPKDVYGCNYCPNCGAKMDEVEMGKQFRTPWLSDAVDLIKRDSTNRIIVGNKEFVQVVWCKDCKWQELCKKTLEYKGADGYCSKGERSN